MLRSWAMWPEIRHTRRPLLVLVAISVVSMPLTVFTIISMTPLALAQENSGSTGEAMDSHMNGHTIEPHMYEALRQNVRRYSDYTDQKIDEVMAGMLPNYHFYIGEPGLQGDLGILVVAHGSGEIGDQVFRQRLSGLGETYPTAIGYGMSMVQSSHLQSAVDDLEAAGARKIVIVPAYHSPYTNQIRNWKYIFGISDKPGWVALPRVESDGELIFASTLKDHPLAVEILIDYAAELSTKPSEEAVMIIAHGPAHDEDNQNFLVFLKSLGSQLKEKAGYASVNVGSLQNDAPDDVRAANVQRIRTGIEDAMASGKRVLVLTTLETPSDLHDKIREDLDGLEYEMSVKGLVEHPNFIKWIESAALEAAAAD